MGSLRTGWPDVERTTPNVSDQCQNVYVNRIAGTSISAAIDADRAEAPFVPLGAVIVKRTRIVSSVHVMLPLGGKFGHAVVLGVDEKLTVPLFGRHSVTAPPFATDNSSPFTTPLPSPIVPLTDAGGAPFEVCAKPLVSTMLVSLDGSSIPTSVHVENAL